MSKSTQHPTNIKAHECGQVSPPCGAITLMEGVNVEGCARN